MQRHARSEYAVVIAAFAGIIAMVVYLLIFRADIPPAGQRQDFDPFSKGDRRMIEGWVVFLSTVTSVGRSYYRIAGDHASDELTRKSLGPWVLLANLGAGGLMIASFAANIWQGQQFAARELVTLFVGLGALGVAVAEMLPAKRIVTDRNEDRGRE